MRRRLLFLTGTRADFGKLKPLIRATTADPRFEVGLFVTGMHTLKQYGYTVNEVHKAGFEDVHVYFNQHTGDPMEMVLANTIAGLSRLIHEQPPELLVIHGDRVEALAGAIVGALTNTLVAHIEGGERSGTIDELIRHAVSKLAHLHFVANDEARARLVQMGELERSTFVVGSPDIDVMMSSALPTLEDAKRRYDVGFADYGILLYHPVTTQVAAMPEHARAVVDAVLASGKPFVVVYPNNDAGTQAIFAEYRRLEGAPRFRVFPSIAFEPFLTLMKHARVVVGNSSAAIREAPIYGVHSINVGDRQTARAAAPSIVNVGHDAAAIGAAIGRLWDAPRPAPVLAFGKGDSAARFLDVLGRPEVWATPRQKLFHDLPAVLGAVGARGAGG